MFEDHLKTCEYCQKNDRAAKLAELGYMIKATSAGTRPESGTRGASSNADNTPRKPGYLERKLKLRELGKMINA
jgi:hypothetical protein